MLDTTDPYGTHSPFLKYYTEITKGDVLEFGTGHNSTGVILETIRGTGRKLISFEHNREWYLKMREIYPPNEFHTYIFVETGNSVAEETSWELVISTIRQQDWSVVFIDQSPWEARVTTMKHFLGHAEYLLIHDVDYFARNNIFGTIKDEVLDYSDVVKDTDLNWKVYYPVTKNWPSPTGPPTLVIGKTVYSFKDPEHCSAIGCGINCHRAN